MSELDLFVGPLAKHAALCHRLLCDPCGHSGTRSSSGNRLRTARRGRKGHMMRSKSESRVTLQSPEQHTAHCTTHSAAGKMNPGLPRDRRKHQPLYYSGSVCSRLASCLAFFLFRPSQANRALRQTADFNCACLGACRCFCFMLCICL